MMRPLTFGKVLHVYCFLLLVWFSFMHDKPHFGYLVEARRVVRSFNPPPPSSTSYMEVKKMLESRSRKLMISEKNSSKTGTDVKARRPKGAPHQKSPPDPNPSAPVYIGPYTKY
ncbi:hypothetical protein MKW98_021315 [Papaver atlanticum]|uniref:Uncharacterized protein n=1 Tax=Papaver atlanticum TaxID=357466 RepID=A0AAD4SRJ5_9MAGN|nr:hypothetical protein MKW98_021315 [Papaver atlanticum]